MKRFDKDEASVMVQFHCRVRSAYTIKVTTTQGTFTRMATTENSTSNLDEMISSIADGIRIASDFRKQMLQELLDELLDAKNETGNR